MHSLSRLRRNLSSPQEAISRRHRSQPFVRSFVRGALNLFGGRCTLCAHISGRWTGALFVSLFGVPVSELSCQCVRRGHAVLPPHGESTSIAHVPWTGCPWRRVCWRTVLGTTTCMAGRPTPIGATIPRDVCMPPLQDTMARSLHKPCLWHCAPTAHTRPISACLRQGHRGGTAMLLGRWQSFNADKSGGHRRPSAEGQPAADARLQQHHASLQLERNSPGSHPVDCRFGECGRAPGGHGYHAQHRHLVHASPPIRCAPRLPRMLPRPPYCPLVVVSGQLSTHGVAMSCRMRAPPNEERLTT